MLEVCWVGSLTLGPWLRGFHQLTNLEVTSTDDVHLQPGLERLTSLQSLKISATPCIKIASLPVNLTRLALVIDELEFVPVNSLQSLQALNELEIQGAGLAASVLSSFSALSRLELLNLSSCGLRAVPPHLTALMMLRNLFFDGAQVSGRQLEVLGLLRNLEVISFCSCNLDVLPTMLSSLRKLRNLFVHDNNIEALAGGWLGRVKVLSSDLSCLCQCVNHLAAASHLECLYISRTGRSSEDSCQELAAALQALPALQEVKYVRSSALDGSNLDENFNFMLLLLQLARSAHLKVDGIEENEIYWCQA